MAVGWHRRIHLCRLLRSSGCVLWWGCNWTRVHHSGLLVKAGQCDSYLLELGLRLIHLQERVPELLPEATVIRCRRRFGHGCKCNARGLGWLGLCGWVTRATVT